MVLCIAANHYTVRSKGKDEAISVSKHSATKYWREREFKAPRIFYLGTKWN